MKFVKCRANTKIPALKDWTHRGTDDPIEVDKLKANAHISPIIWCIPPGWAVLDVDVKEGQFGKESLEALLKIHGEFPEDTPLQRSGSGGQHWIFRLPQDVVLKNVANKVGAGLDIKSYEGGIVVEPSIVNGGKYEWLRNPPPARLDEWVVPLMPQWLLELCLKAGLEKKGKGSSTQGNLASGGIETKQGRQVQSILSLLSREICDNYDSWWRVGAILHNLNSSPEGEMCRLWLEWSSQSAKFSEVACEEKWATFDESKEGNLTLASLVYMAKGEDLTDLGNSARFARLYSDKLKHIKGFGWITWVGGRWVKDPDAPFRYAEELCMVLKQEAQTLRDAEMNDKAERMYSHAMKTQGARNLKNLIELAQIRPEMALDFSRLDADPWLLGVPNGVVNLKTGELLKSSPTQFITKWAGTAFNLDAQCPLWQKFLQTAFDGDLAMVNYFQRWCYYTLTGVNDSQALAMLIGQGANGKSIVFKVLSALMHDYAANIQVDSLMIKQTGAASNDLARLQGKRFVTCPELDDGKRLSESLIKQVTGNDALTVRMLYSEFTEYVPVFKLFLSGNSKPVLIDPSLGLWRRVHLIEFKKVIPEAERDPHLASKLLKELDGILQWCLSGGASYQAKGLQPPQKVLDATNDYRVESDTVEAFLIECTIADEGASTPAEKLYTKYVRWCEVNGRIKMHQQRFSGRMLSKGFSKKQSNGIKYLGLALK